MGDWQPGDGTAVTTSYLWCGSRLCQARNASNTTTREYAGEGEFVPGTPAQPYYYGPDQIGSVRRVFASTSSAPAYRYDPYGNALQATAPLTDFGYAGMFYNADSGLYLTQYRVYDPVSGRWLSRDPSGEMSDPNSNLYPYVADNPVGNTDPSGDFWVGVVGAGVGAIAGAGGNLAAQLIQSGGRLGQVNWSNVGWSAVTGAGAGIALTTGLGGSLAGVVAVGAVARRLHISSIFSSRGMGRRGMVHGRGLPRVSDSFHQCVARSFRHRNQCGEN